MTTPYAETMHAGFIPLLSLFMAALVMKHFRRYLQPRHQGETLGQFLERVREDRRLDKLAAAQMLGPSTAAFNVISMLLLMGFAWVQTIEYVRYVALFYLVAGIAFTREAARTARRPDYGRLGWINRIHYRLFFAWFWPLHLWKSKEETQAK